jgi:hypothetical protein
LDTSTSFYEFLKFEIISEIYLNKNKKRKGVNRAWAESGPWLRPFGEAVCRPLRPDARGRSPTAARPSRLCGPPCARGRDGVRSPRSETARWRERPRLAGGLHATGSGRGHEGDGGGAPGKKIGGGAHPNSDASVGQWGGTARWRSTAVKLARWSPTTGP